MAQWFRLARRAQPEERISPEQLRKALTGRSGPFGPARAIVLPLGIFLTLVAVPRSAAQLSLSITDNNYGQATKDFAVTVGSTLTNTVTWVATNLEGRSGFLFLRFDTAPTVELLPADLTVTFAGSPVPAIKVGFNSMEYHVATIANLGTGGSISYSVIFNKALALNNSRIGIHASGQPFVASNELSHLILASSDTTAPTMVCVARPMTLWPPKHKLVPVTVQVTLTDAGSGPAGFILLSVSSNEPDEGLGDGDLPNDIQGFVVGTPDTSGLLRAERSGRGRGRIYTLTYRGMDRAGNSATVRQPSWCPTT